MAAGARHRLRLTWGKRLEFRVSDQPKSRRDIVILSACFLVLWLVLSAPLMLDPNGQTDFLNLYTGASLALEGRFGDLYSPEVQLARERELVPATPVLYPFVRPPAYALVLAPLAVLPYSAARWVWNGGQILALGICVAWAARRFGFEAIVVGAMYSLAWLGIAYGQDAPLLLLILIGSYTLAEKGRISGSGAVLGLGLIKFHLFLLWPPVLLASRRFRLLAGFAAVGAIELAASLLVCGVAGIRQYAALLTRRDIAHLTPAPERNINLQGLLLNLGWDQQRVYLLVCALVAVCACIAAVRAR